MKPKSQIIEGMPMHEYLAMQDHLSGSALATLWRRPDLFYHNYIIGSPEKTREEHFLIGELTHTITLEPHKFDEQYHLVPAFYKDKKTGKEKKWVNNPNYWYVKEDIEKSEGKTRITASQLQEATNYSEAFANNEISGKILDKELREGFIESTILVQTKDLNFKSRPDILNPNSDIAYNIKTAYSSSPHEFMRSSFDHGYDISAALTAYCYQQHFGKPLKDYMFIVVEKSFPYHVEVFSSAQPIHESSDINYLQLGATRVKQAIKRYRWCIENNYWSAYDHMKNQSIKPMTVNDWMMSRVSEQEETGDE